MIYDDHTNFALSAIVTAPSPADSGTIFTITNGDASIFPTPPFNITSWPKGTPSKQTAEIMRVTDITGDQFTVIRAQENTTAKAIASGFLVADTVTVKTITDIQDQTNLSEKLVNKTNDTTLAGDSSVLYPTEHAVKTYVDNHSSTIVSGSKALGNGVSSGSVTGLALSFTPSRVILSLSRPAGGDFIIVHDNAGTLTSGGFDFELSAPTTSSSFVLNYELFP